MNYKKLYFIILKNLMSFKIKIYKQIINFLTLI
jgi:hypothetical protein